LQRALRDAGDPAPLVEVVRTGAEVPAYQRMARAYGTLVWAATPAPEITVARTYDGRDARGAPTFAPDHPVLDPPDRDAVLTYLRAGTFLLRTSSTEIDVVDPARGPVVPLGLRTDGTWIWPDAVAYYLDHHGLAPDARLVAWIRAAGTGPRELDAVAVHRALTHVLRSGPFGASEVE